MPPASTFTCSSRPGMRDSHGASPANICAESLVRNRISPIQTNSGSAASSQDATDCQIAVERLRPGERVGEERHAHPAGDGQRKSDPGAERKHRQQDGEQNRGRWRGCPFQTSPE